ncbi:MAG TPA: RluA family pseudouridine synthase [Clostridiales bacterium]|nr:RluA family pseudouridine synthase [Clostridiales bacterium]
MNFRYTVHEKDNGRTVRSILRNEFGFSNSLIKRFKYHGQVLCNSKPVYMNQIVTCGDIVEADIHFEEKSETVKPVPMDLKILYEDDTVIALDKPPGIIIHPLGRDSENTMANGLMYYFQSKGCQTKIRPVSRLDRDTTGVIVFAKNQFVHEKLTQQMKTGDYHKKYTGIVHGCPAEKKGIINLPISRAPGSIILREVSPSGDPAVTHYEVVEELKDAAVLHFTLETGRTHQIRVHCREIGHSLIGDTLYSNIPTSLIGRQALHSHMVRFIHPLTGKCIEIISPLPKDMMDLRNALL